MRSRLPVLLVLLGALTACKRESAPLPAGSGASASLPASSVAPPPAGSASSGKSPVSAKIPDLDLEAVKKTVGCPDKPALSACRVLDAFAAAKTPEPFGAGTSIFFGNAYEIGFGADGMESMTTMRVVSGADGVRAVMAIYAPSDAHAEDVTKKLVVSLRAGEPPSKDAKGFLTWLRLHPGNDPALMLVPTTGTSEVLDDDRGAHIFVRVEGPRILVVNYSGGDPIEGGGTRKCMLRIAEVWKI